MAEATLTADPTQAGAEGTQTAPPDAEEAILAQLDAPKEVETPAEQVQNPEGDGTEGDVQEDLIDKAVQEAAEARAQVIAEQRAKEAEAKAKAEQEERAQKEQEEAYNQGIDYAYRNAAHNLRSDLTQQGWSEDSINLAVNRLTEAKGQFDRVHALRVVSQLAEGLPEDQREDFRRKHSEALVNQRTGYPSIVADLRDRLLKDPTVHKGFVSEAEKDAAVKTARLELLKQLRANPALLTNPTVAPMSGGVGISASGLTMAQIEAMPTDQWLAMGDRTTRQNIIDAARLRESRR